MKKVLLVFISILTFSFLLVNNNTYAQETYPYYLMKADYLPFVLYPIRENDNTIEYELEYYLRFIIDTSVEFDYYLFSEEVLFKKGIDRSTNSYELIEIYANDNTGFTEITLHVTVLKTVVDEYTQNPEIGPVPLFRYYSVLYLTYISDTGSIDYDNGYTNGYDDGYNKGRDDGYNQGYDSGYDTGYDVGYLNGVNSGFQQGYDEGYDDGYNTGYDIGYTDGVNTTEPEAYQRGYEEGQKSTLTRFIDNFHVWFIPAIIIVFAIGVFVSYRKGRDE